jgi:chloride channel protein, CIC family
LQTDSRHEDKVLLVLTLIIGAVVGLVVVAFILVTERLGGRLYPEGGAAWRRLVIPVAGSLFSGYLLARYFPNARGSGIPQTKVALFLRDGYISLRTVAGKFGLCSVTLASGIALGREGPSVQVSAGIASVLGRRLGLSPAGVKALVPVGASAALAAAFNTPIAAVLFSLEEVMGDMHAPVLGSIVLSSATSWIVLHLLLGDEPLFHVPAYQLVHPIEFVWYAVLGLVGGFVSVAFTKLLLVMRKRFLSLPKKTVPLQPVVGGLLVGMLGWYFPKVLGVGYGVVGEALNGHMLVGAMALLVCLKLLATTTCYASGNAGGIFGPSLFIGAMMGGAVGGVAHMLMPDYTGSAGAYALVGMGAAFAGIIRVPLTSVIMIFEITRDYSIIVPLMISNLMAYYISSRFQDEPIYEALQHQDGIHLPSGGRAREALLMVGNAFRPEAQVLSADETIEHAAASVDRERGAWPVSDAAGLRGMVTAGQLDEAIQGGRGAEPLSALVPSPGPIEELTEDRFPHVHADHSLELAMRRLAEYDLPVLPVVSRDRVRELKGTISLADILKAYGIGRTEAPVPASAAEERAAGIRTSRMLAGTVAALIGLATVAGCVSYFYRTERTARAERAFQQGNQLLAKERMDEAVEQFRNAVSISHSVEHRLGLGLALAQAGQLPEASIYLNEVIRENPNSGLANLGLARISAAEGNIDAATIYYQRAASGSWPANPDRSRFTTRLELAQALQKAGRVQQARAELISAAATAPDDPALHKETAVALLDYGLPRNAADVFRQVLKRNPRDLAAYDGLGQAEFALGDYNAARTAFQDSLKLDPTDSAALKGAELSDRVLALDPVLRGLGAAERYRRSHEVLTQALAARLQCSPSTDQDVEAAQAALARKRRPASLSDTADAELALARQLWAERVKSCAAPAANDPLGYILKP